MERVYAHIIPEQNMQWELSWDELAINDLLVMLQYVYYLSNQ